MFSEVDRKSLHVRLADKAYPIGPAPSRESYLRIDKLMDVARAAGCDAVHPGYGFLAENPALPRACGEAGITFIGPSAEAMEAPSLENLTDPTQRMFRAFADQTKSDRAALAACIRGSHQSLTPAGVARIAAPTLIAVGTRDAVAGDPHKLAAMMPRAEALDIPGRACSSGCAP